MVISCKKSRVTNSFKLEKNWITNGFKLEKKLDYKWF